jgi:SAM-dependent methyltransferase
MDMDFRVDNVLNLSTCHDATFDLVVDGHCLHCIIGEDRAICLASVYRVLKPGGSFVVLTMCGEVTNQKMLKSFDHDRKVTIHQGQPTRYIGAAAAILSEVIAAGFVAEGVRVVPRKDADDLDNLILRAKKPVKF